MAAAGPKPPLSRASGYLGVTAVVPCLTLLFKLTMQRTETRGDYRHIRLKTGTNILMHLADESWWTSKNNASTERTTPL